MKTHVLPTESIMTRAAKALDEELSKHKKKGFLFLSSGGSSLALLDLMDMSNFGPWSTISVLDERYSSDPAINNFAQLAKTDFYEKAVKRGCSFIDARPALGESIEDLAQRFEGALKEWEKEDKGSIIATVGIGSDAHTAGIMPYPKEPELFTRLFDVAEQWVVSYDAGSKNPYPARVTVTLPFLRRIDFALCLVKGKDKAEAMKKLNAETGKLNESPCRILRELPRVEIFTEQSLL